MAKENEDIFGMSDDEFAKMNPNSLSETSAETQGSSTVEEQPTTPNETVEQEQPENADTPPAADPSGSNTPAAPADASAAGHEPPAEPEKPQTAPEDDDPADDQIGDKPPVPAEPKQPEKVKTEAEPKLGPDGKPLDPVQKPEGDKPKEGEPAQPKEPAAATPDDHKALYENLIGKPIKANGKELVLKTPEEVLRMVQMGAGYGKKLQDMQPHIKTLRMLEKNQLLDENRLSFLIELDQKNPDAIKKLIKDSGIDPLDLNMEDNAEYQPKSHAVPDAEIRFKEALDELVAHPQGQETIRTINTTWDEESKNALWDQPQLFGVIQTQRENGIYDVITAEIDRQKMLGSIPQSMPFLKAYKVAGDHLAAAGKFGTQASEATTPTPPAAPAAPVQPRVLETRPALPKASENDAKVRAASPTQASTRKAQEVVNPLDMADDEFLKNFKL